MDRRQKIGLALMLLALLLCLLYWLLPRGEETPTVTPGDQPATAGQGGLIVAGGTDKTPLTAKPITSPDAASATASQPVAVDASLRPLARTFAERYLSFSTAGDYENLNDAKLMMTPSFAARTDARIAAEAAAPPAEFFGVTSRAISLQLGAYDETAGTAAMVVDMSRQERTGGGVLRTPYAQRLTVMFLKIDGTWKVDDAFLESYKR